jgi:hypothetical protein
MLLGTSLASGLGFSGVGEAGEFVDVGTGELMAVGESAGTDVDIGLSPTPLQPAPIKRMIIATSIQWDTSIFRIFILFSLY